MSEFDDAAADVTAAIGYHLVADFYDAMELRPAEVRSRLKALARVAPADEGGRSADLASDGEVRA
jgi:hypothetical protein